ncbi:MAG TPA: LysE family transporter [Chitinophagaceae bacterium]|nr:LysE family transporter [Chitinophagaceae bacterium]
MEYIFTFCWGWFVSFAGQLPLGTMSITSAQIAVEENFRNAWKYSLGVALIEIVYLRFTLSGVDWIIQHKLIFEILGWTTVAVFLVLGILTFRAALKQTEEKKAYLLNNNLNRYILGITMSALNPAQIPFWFIWSSALIDSNALHTTTTDFNLFTAGAGLGTISGLAFYMYGGNWIITKMKAGTKIINIIMGVIFIIAALAQLYRMLFGEFIEK